MASIETPQLKAGTVVTPNGELDELTVELDAKFFASDNEGRKLWSVKFAEERYPLFYAENAIFEVA